MFQVLGYFRLFCPVDAKFEGVIARELFVDLRLDRAPVMEHANS